MLYGDDDDDDDIVDVMCYIIKSVINCFRAKEQVKERIQALSASLNPNPSAPNENVVDGQTQNGHLATDEELEACYLSDQEANSWEDVKELLVLEHSMKQFIYVLVLRLLKTFLR